MKKQVGFMLIVSGAVLIVALTIAKVSPSLPSPLGLGLIVLPSTIGGAAAVLCWYMLVDRIPRFDAIESDLETLIKEQRKLSEDVGQRLTLLMVTNGDEQRRRGQAEGAASIPSVDQLAIATAAAAAAAFAVQPSALPDAAIVAKELVEKASIVAKELVERTSATTNIQTTRLENIEHNTAATVQAIKDNHL
jgi:hypothetical protein